MSYIDAIWDKKYDKILVAERTPVGKRNLVSYPAKYVLYYPDRKGMHTSIFGDPLIQVQRPTYKDFQREVKSLSNKKLFESDINPVFRCLEENYIGNDAPNANVAFFDIETDMQPFAAPSQSKVKIQTRYANRIEDSEITVFQLSQRVNESDTLVWNRPTKQWVSIPGCKYLEPGPGYAKPEDPFMPITAIAVYLQWMETMVCLALPPAHLSMAEATEMVKDFPNTILFDNEEELLRTFVELVDDADILSGWNSEGFDIPYTINRITRLLGREYTRKLCLWGHLPKQREYEKFGKKSVTYDLVGRVHLDSLELYRKYNYEERHSYRLDAIGELEVGEKKTVYEGTLDQLYNNDFRKFIEYNRQDCTLLDKLDKKLRFISLANGIAHENTVLLQTTMGAVAVTEQAIINQAHKLGLIVPNRVRHEEGSTQAAGAYVAHPRKGLWDWVGSLDINSLYPSVIRALNMGPETIVGQLRQTYTDAFIANKIANGSSFAAAWEGKFGADEYELVMNQDIARPIHLDWENGSSDVLTGAQIYELIFNSNQPWILSANGTIFTVEREGVIPGLLKQWYAERKRLQRIMTGYIDLNRGIEIPERLKA